MESSDRTREVFARAQRAYELGRARRAVRPTPAIAAMAVISHRACFLPEVTICAAIALAVTCGCCVWRGRAYERAVWPGLAAGFGAALIPFFVQSFGWCTPDYLALCVAACGAGGVLAGVAIATLANRLDEGRRAFALAGGTIAILTASLGCAIVGLGGILGMAAGLALAAAPMLLAARA